MNEIAQMVAPKFNLSSEIAQPACRGHESEGMLDKVQSLAGGLFRKS